MKTVHCIKELCMSCHQCEAACSIEHSTGKTLGDALSKPMPAAARISIRQSKATNRPFPVICRHCNPAPCIRSCSSGALQRDFSTGLVIIDEYKCFGCKNCIAACPFGAIGFGTSGMPGNNHPIALKCNGCIQRIKQGEEPACVDSCITEALIYAQQSDTVQQRRKIQSEKHHHP